MTLQIFQSKISLLLMSLSIAGLAFVPVYASNGTVVLLILGALALGKLSNISGLFFQVIENPASKALILLLAWIFISLTWGDANTETIKTAIAVTALCFAGILFMTNLIALESSALEKISTVFIASCAAMVALFLLEFATAGTVAKFLKGTSTPHLDFIGRGVTILICIAWPTVILIQNKFSKMIWSLLFLIGVSITVLIYPQDTLLLAFFSGLLTFSLIYRYKRSVGLILFSLVALYIISMPFVTRMTHDYPPVKSYLDKSTDTRFHRLKIWNFVSKNIEKHPIVGHGFEAARNIGQEQQKIYQESLKTLPPNHQRMLLPLHPHNVPLQIWLELGLVGILFYLGILLGIGRFIWAWNGPPIWLAAIGASTVSFLTVSSLSVGAWQNWWLATGWLTAGILVLARKTFEQTSTNIS